MGGFNIAGSTILSTVDPVTLGKGISFNSLAFNGFGQGTANARPGYSAWKGGGSTYYSGVSGWELNTTRWQSGLNTLTGLFTCPIDGIYAMGYNGIHRGGQNLPSGFNTYGYGGFAKNGVLSYFIHWNMSASNAWNTGGTSALFNCAANDSLALFINRAPTSVAPDSISQNYGLYPDAHHAVWCKLVG